jgi:RNA polymerase sigma-70 factor (ECF subfamily)
VDPEQGGDRTDEVLVEAAQGGDVRALDLLINRHQARVLRVLGFLGVVRQDREDVAQEVFIRVLRYLEGFRRGQPFSAWIYRVTVNAAHDWAGRRGRVARAESPWDAGLEQVVDPAVDPAAAARAHELGRLLRQAMAELSPRERAVFTLRELEGLETAEVARVLGITQVTVRRHHGRAVRRLRSALGGEGQKEISLAVERVAPGGSSH